MQIEAARPNSTPNHNLDTPLANVYQCRFTKIFCKVFPLHPIWEGGTQTDQTQCCDMPSFEKYEPHVFEKI